MAEEIELQRSAAATLRIRVKGRLWNVPYEPNPAPVDALFSHVTYGIEMAYELSRALFFYGRYETRDFPEGTVRRLNGSALLEANLLHIRTLIEFLYKYQTATINQKAKDTGTLLAFWSDDILAIDFVADAQDWLDNRPTRGRKLKRAWNETNKGVFHLSRSRVPSRGTGTVEPAQKGQLWPPAEYLEALRPRLRYFLDAVSVPVDPDDLARAYRALAIAGPKKGDFVEIANTLWDETRGDWAPMRVQPADAD